MATKKSGAKKTAGRRAAPVDTTGVVVTNDQLNAITHVARMQRALEARPDHPRAEEYARVIAGYRAFWAGQSPAARSAAAEAAEAIHDMTADAVASAVATLED